MTIPALKKAMRRDVTARILAVDPAARRAEEGALAARFATLPGLDRAATVLLYASAFPEEIDTRPMLARALALGKRLVCPRVDRPSRRLRLHEVIDPAVDLIPGVRGIPEPGPDCPEVEPSEIDWVLVPGLAFDRRGYRLGRGAGHYDRLLPTLRPGVPAWALILEAQWVPEVPTEPHDRPISGVANHRAMVGDLRVTR